MSPRIMGAVLATAASLGLGACTTYDQYGYPTTQVSVGVGYGSPYYGWYDDYYYPGIGYYIYDRYGERYRWSGRHRDYWYARRTGHRHYRAHWDGYNAPHRYRDMPHYRDHDRRERHYGDRDRRWRDDDDRRDRRRDGARNERRTDRDHRARNHNDRRAGDNPRNRDADAPRARPVRPAQNRNARPADVRQAQPDNDRRERSRDRQRRVTSPRSSNGGDPMPETP